MNTEAKESKTNSAANQTADDHQTDKLADLAVSDEQAEQTKGGLPAVQRVRETAGRSVSS